MNVCEYVHVPPGEGGARARVADTDVHAARASRENSGSQHLPRRLSARPLGAACSLLRRLAWAQSTPASRWLSLCLSQSPPCHTRSTLAVPPPVSTRSLALVVNPRSHPCQPTSTSNWAAKLFNGVCKAAALLGADNAPFMSRQNTSDQANIFKLKSKA